MLSTDALPRELLAWASEVIHDHDVRRYRLGNIEGGDVAAAHRALLGLLELESGEVISTSRGLRLRGVTYSPRTKRLLDLSFGTSADIVVQTRPPYAKRDSILIDAVPTRLNAVPVVRFDDVDDIALYRMWWTNFRPNGDLAPVISAGTTRDTVDRIDVELVRGHDPLDAIARDVAAARGHHFIVDRDGTVYQTTDVMRWVKRESEMNVTSVSIGLVVPPDECGAERTDAQAAAMAELQRVLATRFPGLATTLH